MANGVKVQHCAAGDGQQWVDYGEFPSVAAAEKAMPLSAAQIRKLAKGKGTQEKRRTWRVNWLDEEEPPAKPAAKKPAAAKPAAKPKKKDPKPKAKSAAKPAAAGSAKKKPTGGAPSKTSSVKKRKGAEPENPAGKKVKVEGDPVPEDARNFLDILQKEIAGQSMGLDDEPGKEENVCHELKKIFNSKKSWIRKISYDKKRESGRSTKRPDFQFKHHKALLEIKYGRQNTNEKEHLLAQVCDYLAYGNEKALDVWTCYYDENGPGISFERDTDTQEWIDKMAGKDQRGNLQGKTWPRCWRVDFS